MHSRTTFRLITFVAACYAAILSALAVLWQFRPRVWWVTITRIFAAHLFWPTLALVPLAVGSRSRVLQVLVAWPVLLFAALFGRRFVPRRIRHTNGSTFRIATYNLNYRNQEMHAIVAAIRALRADVVALQELTPELAVVLTQELSEAFPYQLLAPAERQHGLGVISRYPFCETHDEPGFRGQRVVVQIAERVLTLINAHPTIADIEWHGVLGRFAIPTGYEPGLRAVHLANLVAKIDSIHGNLIVAGDFNTAESEAEYASFAVRLRDAFVEAGYGLGLTFPARCFLPPLVRIDYIWLCGALVPQSAWVEHVNGGSDHRIVVADVALGD